jgi:hypothetical protein
MEHSYYSDREPYAVIVTRREASEILLEKTSSGYSIPILTVWRSQRIVAQLNQMAFGHWDLDTYCLWIERSVLRDPNSLGGLAILDTLRFAAEPPQGMAWVSLNDGESPRDRFDAGTVELIRRALGELRSSGEAEVARPFARPGWIRHLCDWIQDRIDPFGYHLTGELQQLHGDSGSCLIRLETTGPAMWFKAAGAANPLELQITTALAKLFPEALPKVIAIHPEWNGWLAQEVTGVTLDRAEDITTWERVAVRLAELQIASIDRRPVLLAEGCRDGSLAALAEHIGPFLGRWADCLDSHRAETSPGLETTEFAFLADSLRESCNHLQEIGLPDAIAHLDLNFGNVICSGDGCVFLDWAEAAIASPLTTFEYLRQLAKCSHIRGYGASVRINAAYLRAWHDVVSPDRLAKAFRYSPIVAVFTFALACDRWGERCLEASPTRARTLRSLIRRMYREAVRLRNSPCAA